MDILNVQKTNKRTSYEKTNCLCYGNPISPVIFCHGIFVGGDKGDQERSITLEIMTKTMLGGGFITILSLPVRISYILKSSKGSY